jgi:hypothetical protein
MPTRAASLSNAINRVMSESLGELSDRQLLDRFEQSGDQRRSLASSIATAR